MKKTIPIIAIAIIAIGVIGWQSQTHSQANVRYPEPANCEQATYNRMQLMRAAWNQNLKELMNQEKPASSMVDEAFESMRTYRCWLNYLCESVLFSGNADLNKMKGVKLDRGHIGKLPQCINPTKLEIPGVQVEVIPECHVGRTYTHQKATNNYNACLSIIEREFVRPKDGADASDQYKNFQEKSSAYVAMESALKSKSATQRSQVLGKKMRGLLRKMHDMESHMTSLSELVQRFDQLFACYAPKCD